MPTTEAPADETVIHVLWINAGLSCDGDSVALTAATQPSIEEIALGALPGLPKIAVHWPLIDFECGPVGGADDFIEWFFKADRGELEPFVLVVEGSIPNEAIKSEGYWCGFGNNPETDQPMTTSEWLDRLAPKALAVRRRRHLRDVRRHPRHGRQPDRRDGRARLPRAGAGSRRPASRSCACPGCPIQPDNLSETILYLLYQATGQAPMIPLDEALRPQWLFGATVHEGCDRAGYYEQGDFAHRVRLAEVHRQARLLGAGGQVQRAQARLDERRRRLPERRRHLHRLHDARLPRQVHAVHGRAARRAGVDDGERRATARAIRALAQHHQRRPSTRNRSGAAPGTSCSPATRATWR